MAEELDRDRPLFNDSVQVQVKFPDHDKSLALTVRVLQGSRVAPVGSGGGQREGVLHIEITDELDPFFLYTLQVRERTGRRAGCGCDLGCVHACAVVGRDKQHLLWR